MAEMRFDEQVVLITGGARGIGFEHAKLLASRGARLLISDVGNGLYGDGVDADLVEHAAQQIRDGGGVAEAHCGDLMQEDQARGAVARALATFGRLDALVHNAGFTLGSMPFEDEGLARLDKQLAVNTRAGYALAQEAWPIFQRQGGGRIVLTGSTAMYGIARSTPYSTAKASYIGLARALAREGEGQCIRVNAVAPSGASRMSDNMPDSAFKSWFTDTLRPERISPLVAWLVHPDCDVTGEVFVTAGGRVARTVFFETEGYINPDLTIEDLRDHRDAIMADAKLRPVSTFQASMDLTMELLGFDSGGAAIRYAGDAGKDA